MKIKGYKIILGKIITRWDGIVNGTQRFREYTIPSLSFNGIIHLGDDGWTRTQEELLEELTEDVECAIAKKKGIWIGE